jgi:hypothetical protein
VLALLAAVTREGGGVSLFDEATGYSGMAERCCSRSTCSKIGSIKENGVVTDAALFDAEPPETVC